MLLALGISGSVRAQTPAQPGYPPAPVQQPPSSGPGQPPGSSATQPRATPPPVQPGYPPPPQVAAPPPGAGTSPSQYPPPQYPPQPVPAYPPQPDGQASGPPPGYAQPPYPPAGYPQPSPPAGTYQYPPGNYPQQPYGQSGYPPPGYPPPGYYPPPSYPSQAPPPPPSSRPHGHGGLLLLPYVGIQAHEGASGENQDIGFRLGTLIGYRFNGQFSLNAELTVDVLNLTNAPTGVDLSGAEVDVALSPLYHFDAGSLELVIGPKVGIWGGDIDAKDTFGTTKTSSGGVIVGANVGAFVPLGNGASLGGLLSFLARTIDQVCTTSEAGFRSCDENPHVSSEKVLGITGAALF